MKWNRSSHDSKNSHATPGEQQSRDEAWNILFTTSKKYEQIVNNNDKFNTCENFTDESFFIHQR